MDRLRASATTLAGEHDTPQWAILRCPRSTPGPRHRAASAATGPVGAIRHHVEVVLPFDALDNGLPTDAALGALRSFADSLDPLLGADGALLAHESGNGIGTWTTTWTAVPTRRLDLRPLSRSGGGGRSRVRHDPELAAIRLLRA